MLFNIGSKIYDIDFSSEKVLSPESENKYIQTNHRLQAKTVQNSSKHICWWILMWEDKNGCTFLLEEALLWSIHSYFGQK